jgi:hypothetical protein
MSDPIAELFIFVFGMGFGIAIFVAGIWFYKDNIK